MGISGLLPVLKEIQVYGNISEFKGKRLAVDVRVLSLPFFPCQR
jgi:exonuclease-1